MLSRMLELGCDLAQGFYISRAMPEPELLRWCEPIPRSVATLALTRRWPRRLEQRGSRLMLLVVLALAVHRQRATRRRAAASAGRHRPPSDLGRGPVGGDPGPDHLGAAGGRSRLHVALHVASYVLVGWFLSSTGG